MTSEEDWLLRPVLKGMCKYESLLNGTLRLVDFAKMNEVLDIEIENERRMNKQ